MQIYENAILLTISINNTDPYSFVVQYIQRIVAVSRSGAKWIKKG